MMKCVCEYEEMSFRANSTARNSAENTKNFLVGGSLRWCFHRLGHSQQDHLPLNRQCKYQCNYDTESDEMKKEKYKH